MLAQSCIALKCGNSSRTARSRWDYYSTTWGCERRATHSGPRFYCERRWAKWCMNRSCGISIVPSDASISLSDSEPLLSRRWGRAECFPSALAPPVHCRMAALHFFNVLAAQTARPLCYSRNITVVPFCPAYWLTSVLSNPLETPSDELKSAEILCFELFS